MDAGSDTRDWQELAELDPYWAALTERRKRFGQWDPSEFLASGEAEVARLLEHAETIGHPARRRAALDFGCGPGRLTGALAARFESAVGVDASKRMLDQARALHRGVENVRFVAGERALETFDAASFDLVYSNLVLQHVSDRDAVIGYVTEFVRVLAPGGLLAFQLPSHLPLARRLQPRRRLYRALRSLGLSPSFLFRRARLDPVGLHAAPAQEIVSAIESAGGRMIRVDEAPWPGGVVSATYFATR